MDEKIEEYIVDIVEATRNPDAYKLDIKDYIRYGASPRPHISCMASKATPLWREGLCNTAGCKKCGNECIRAQGHTYL
jgi:hypothetical protein